MTKILIDKNTTIDELITQHGNIIDRESFVYGFVPFWFKKEAGSDKLEMLHLGNLPKDLCEQIESERHPVKREEVKIFCYEFHRPNIPADGCKTQCKECSEMEMELPQFNSTKP